MNYIYIDVLKIVSAFFVVLLHTTAYKIYDVGGSHWEAFITLNAITRFAVPVFFMVSGALLLEKQESIKNFLKKRVTKIVLPFVFWSFFYEGYLVSCGNSKTLLNVITDLYSDKVMYHMWFMYILLTLYILTPIIRKFLLKMEEFDYKYLLSAWVLLAANGFIGKMLGMSSPLILGFFPGAMCYFILGYFLHYNSRRKSEKKNIILALIIVVVSILMMTNLTIWFSHGKNTFEEAFFANSSLFVILGSMAIFFLFSKSEALLSQANDLVKRKVHFIGKLTFGCYLMHVLVLDKLYTYLYAHDFCTIQYPLLGALFISVSVFFICLLISALLKSIPGIRNVI